MRGNHRRRAWISQHFSEINNTWCVTTTTLTSHTAHDYDVELKDSAGLRFTIMQDRLTKVSLCSLQKMKGREILQTIGPAQAWSIVVAYHLVHNCHRLLVSLKATKVPQKDAYCVLHLTGHHLLWCSSRLSQCMVKPDSGPSHPEERAFPMGDRLNLMRRRIADCIK